MIELELSVKTLLSIFKEKISFQEAIKNAFPKDSEQKQYQSFVSKIVGCELRHNILFEKLLENDKPNLSDEELILVCLALANNQYLKRLDKNTVNEYVKATLKEKYSDRINTLLETDGSVSNMIENVDKDSLDYISLRFNTPKWILKMWQKHYGKAITFKVLKRNIKSIIQVGKVNTRNNRASVSSLIESYPNDFTECALPGYVTYKGAGQLRKHQACRENKLMAVRYGIGKFFADLNIEESNQTLCINENDEVFTKLFVEKVENGHNGYLAVPTFEGHPELLRIKNNAKNCYMFDCTNYSEMDSAITYQIDLGIVYPKSSSFDDIRIVPDFFLRFNKDTIDSLIENQKLALEGASKYIQKDGRLVYVVNTLNKKETSFVVNSFLENHKDFELVSENQNMPYDEYDTCLYVAVLKKIEA